MWPPDEAITVAMRLVGRLRPVDKLIESSCHTSRIADSAGNTSTVLVYEMAAL